MLEVLGYRIIKVKVMKESRKSKTSEVQDVIEAVFLVRKGLVPSRYPWRARISNVLFEALAHK